MQIRETGTPAPSWAAADSRVMTAFLLGWSVSELLGLVRKGIRPQPQRAERPPGYAPRLAVSEGFPQRSIDSAIVTAERLVYLYHALGFSAVETPSPLTQQVFELPQKVRDRLQGRVGEFYPPRDLRKLLNDWTLEVWARLGGVSPESAQAFTAGMSLADTYWYMRPPGRREPEAGEPLAQESWRRLLSPYRLYIEQSRLLWLKRYFPPYVADVMRNQLRKWSVGTELDYVEGRLVRVARQTARSELKPDDEENLQHALARQVFYWNAMLFGFREATTYLLNFDRWIIRILSTLAFLLGLLVVLALLVIALVGVGYLLIVGVLPIVQPALSALLAGQPIGVSDVLSFANLAWTILIAIRLPQLAGVAYQAARNAQSWVDYNLSVELIARHTYVPWDSYLRASPPPASAPG